MKYLFYLVIGVGFFCYSYFLTVDSNVKKVSIQEISQKLNKNEVHPKEIENFNKIKQEKKDVTFQIYEVEAYLQDHIIKNKIRAEVYIHLTENSSDPKVFEKQFSDLKKLVHQEPEKTLEDFKSLLRLLKENKRLEQFSVTLFQMSQFPEFKLDVETLALDWLKEVPNKESVAAQLQIEPNDHSASERDEHISHVGLIYQAYLNSQISAGNNPLNETINIMSQYESKDIQRSIASNYIDVYPESSEEIRKFFEDEKDESNKTYQEEDLKTGNAYEE